MPLLINDVYVDGRLSSSPATLDETYAALTATGGTAWVVLSEPDGAELASLADRFDLHELAVEDAGHGHQRAKLERYGSTLFVVVRPAVYQDAEESVAFGEIHVFVGPDFFVAINHVADIDQRYLARSTSRLRAKPELLEVGPQAILWAVLDAVVDAYTPVVDGLENDIDEIEQQLFAGEATVARRIYELFGEVADFQKATRPLVGMLDGLIRGGEKYRMGTELERRLRDVQDHVIRVVDRADTFRAVLQNALSLNATLVAQVQNDVTKRISAWAAILLPRPSSARSTA